MVRKKYIEEFIKRQDSIIHGRKALNMQLPQQLQRRTKDWDLYDKTPKREANMLEKEFDNIVKQDRFYVQEVPLAGSKETVYRVMI